MLRPGIYPAAVTPFDESGRIDMPSVARLLAWFEAAGCQGAVLAGTNGEGASLGAVEKRDLLRTAMPLRGDLDLIMGVATSSTDEAVWLCKQAGNDGAKAVLLMPPYYFREATEEGNLRWFEHVLDRSPIPILVYNFPRRTGFTMTAEFLGRLAGHERFLGAKDSSGEAANIQSYAAALSGKLLFVGDETLLYEALEAGWSGSISGAANVLPMWLSQIEKDWRNGDRESANTKFELVLPVIKQLRSSPQPAVNKALLARHGVLSRPDLRPPLLPASREDQERVADSIESTLGLRFESPCHEVSTAT